VNEHCAPLLRTTSRALQFCGLSIDYYSPVMLLYLLTLLGVTFFAVSGALRAGEKGMDFFGVVVIAAITATGGGTIRDVLLGTQPVFWIEDINFLLVSAAAATTTVLYTRLREPPINSLLVTDAFGLAVATVIGAQAAAEAGASPLIVVVMGVTTGVAGGILRDVLCAEVPLILKKEIYATASMAGAATYVALSGLAQANPVIIVIPMAIIFAIRLAAIQFGIHTPPSTPNKDA
jgi:uncharacterized membrane protein YeiH